MLGEQTQNPTLVNQATHPRAPKIAMVAGEASGDLLASLIIRGILARWPDAQIYGIGGELMCSLGFRALWPAHKLSVRGYLEVLMHYRGIAAIRRSLMQLLLQDPPDLFIGVDAPDFNLYLERCLKERSIKTIHFVCPSIWAWRAGRAKTLSQSADHVLCVFPFEPGLLAKHQIAATYVGHPVADMATLGMSQNDARESLGIAARHTGVRVITLMPGSRASEARHMTPRFLQAARLLAEKDPALEFLLPVVPHLEAVVREMCSKVSLPRLKILCGSGLSHTALAACDVVLVASGTATLEAALFKRAMVIAYHVNWFSYWLIWPQRLLPWIGLPNILCQRQVVPELLQSRATPSAMAREILAWLDSPERMREVVKVFEDLHEQLKRDTSTLATRVIESLLK